MEKKVLQLRLPAELHTRLVGVRGARSLNAEIVLRLEDSFLVDAACASSSVPEAEWPTRAEVLSRDVGTPKPVTPKVFESERPRALAVDAAGVLSSGRARTGLCVHRRRADEFCPRCD